MGPEYLSKANWIDKERCTVYPRIFVAIYLMTVVIVLALSPNMIFLSAVNDERSADTKDESQNIGTDFMDVWAAGKLALQGKPAAAYDYQQHMDVQKAALQWPHGKKVPFYGWHYPPMFLMAAEVLALLPYGIALLVWMALTLPMYLAAIRAIIPGREAMMAALAFPAVFVNIGHGQNGFLTAGLFGGALALLEKRPWVSGILFGLLAYKPQFGVIIPIALLAGRHWRPIVSATATVLATAALSYALFGIETWKAFIGSAKLTQDIVLEQGGTGFEKIQSIFAAVRLWHGGIGLAYNLQGIVALAATVAVIWAWRRDGEPALKYAVLAVASLMATPYVLDYDLIILALPIAWMASVGLRSGFLPWEKFTLFLAFLLPLLTRMVAQYLYLPLGPVIMSLLLAMILRRMARKA
jgi:hypothetical protein